MNPALKSPSRSGKKGWGAWGFRALVFAGVLSLTGCSYFNEKPQPRLVMFVGVDISGSFIKGNYFDDSIDFLSNYLYAHLNGMDGLEVPSALFVGSIGGAKSGQPKAFFPIETFQNKSVAEIAAKLRELFPKDKLDPWTDYNAFFEQVAETVKDRKMVLKPVSMVLLTDGEVDIRTKNGRHDYRGIDLLPLEKLSRNITIRLLYPSPEIAQKWESVIPRRRVKVWSQDAVVMATWKDPKIYLPDQPIEKQDKFFSWLENNVDFNVRMKRVD
jgi:hypothetical protein